MTAIIVALSVVLPLLPVILFPTRFFRRGGMWPLLGAAILIGGMLLLAMSLRDATDDTAKPDADASALAGMSDADLSALEKLF